LIYYKTEKEKRLRKQTKCQLKGRYGVQEAGLLISKLFTF